MTAASREEAGRIAEMLVAAKLAACVQILPQVESIFRWKGKVETSSEVLLIAKTELRKFAELELSVRANHSYETPEIVALPTAAISTPYLEWLISNIDS